MSKSAVVEIAVLMYANEPCRICGEILTRDDIVEDGAVFAGYSSGDEARSAHKSCWNKYPSHDGKTPRPEWRYQ
jgi:hypothetical protein